MKQSADIILTGNHIFRGAAFETAPGFVAVAGNRIIGTGTQANDLKEFRSAKTEIIDCREGFIMPGFHDCHVHIIQGGIFQNGVELSDCKSEEEAARRVGDYAAAHPKMPWILGCGWYHIYWDRKEYPSKESLDRHVKDRPVFLENEDGHGAWVNSKALELAGVTKDTKDPEFGEIFRDTDGNPTGYLDELAMLLCGRLAYDLPQEYERKLFRDFLTEASKNGISSVNDMRPFFTMDLGRLETYEALDADGKQPVRIHFTSNLFHDIEESKALRQRYSGGKLHYFGLKEFIDGVAISYTSLLKEDYADKTGTKGYALLERGRLEEAVLAAQKANIPVHLHVTGDAAVSLSLDAFAHARDMAGNHELRHSLEHIDLIDPADIPRLRQLNVVASMQPQHMAPTEAFEDNPYPIRFGSERSRYTWAIASILHAGTTLAFGTDFPVAELNPLGGIYRAVTRRSDDGMPQEGWNPEQRISLKEALDAYTLGSAKMVGREHELGSLETGKLADITVLSANPFEVPKEDLTSIGIAMTICDGRVVYTK